MNISKLGSSKSDLSRLRLSRRRVTKRDIALVVEALVVVVLFGPSALLVAVPALWISREYGSRGVRFLLAMAVGLMVVAAIVSFATTTRLDALYADRRALAENFGGLAAAIVVIAVAEFARVERAFVHRPAAHPATALSQYDEEP